MNLHTGKVIMQNRVTAIPLTKIVKYKVEQMANDQGITTMKYLNKNNCEIPNIDWDEDEDYNCNIINPIMDDDEVFFFRLRHVCIGEV